MTPGMSWGSRPQSRPGALRRLLPLRSSRSVSMSRDWTQVRNAWSVRTVSQLRSSVKARFMPSLTSKSLASSAASSASAVSGRDISPPNASPTAPPAKPYDAFIGGNEKLCGRRVGVSDEQAMSCAGGAAELGVTGVQRDALRRGRSSSRCCLRDSCCSCRRRYFCSARSGLWWG